MTLPITFRTRISKILFLVLALCVVPSLTHAAPVATVSPTGNLYLDGLLSGVKWAVSNLSFSAPADPTLYGTNYGSGETANAFEAFTDTQLAFVRKVLSLNASVYNMTFTELTETPVESAVLRYAESDSVSTAWGYYPNTSATGGDSWYNNTKNYYDNPGKGNYAGLTMMHETGHTTGLKHPHSTSGSFQTMPLDKDSLEYSVMSYRSYVTGPASGYTVANGSYPQSLMALDIAALQYEYGANFTTNAGDTVYKWSALTGETFVNGIAQGAPVGNKIFMTIWDGGGRDTYDFSNYTIAWNVDLRPGNWSKLATSTAQLANLASGVYAAGNIANALLYNNNPASLIEDVVGGAGGDSIVGNDANNTFTGGAGNDTFDGGSGNNTAVYASLKANYLVTTNADGSSTVADLRSGAPEGVDVLRNIQTVRFADASVTIGTPVPVNHAPIATNDSYGVDMNAVLSVSTAAGVLVNDSDQDGNQISATLVSPPLHGSLTLQVDGSFAYTPVANYYGPDTFSYKANDGSLDSNTASVSVAVQQVIPPDTTVPTTSITSPVNGALVSGTVSIAAVASDNVAVTKVDFYKDGVLLSTDVTAPYSSSWNTMSESNSLHTLQSKAYDATGNLGTSIPISVTVNNPVASSTFTIGDRVKTTAAVNVRSSPSTGGKPGKQKAGVPGTIILGPEVGSGYTWWKVNFDTGTDGWVVQEYLSRL